RDRVDVRRGRHRQRHGAPIGMVLQALHQEAGAVLAAHRDHIIERLEPLAGFGAVDVLTTFGHLFSSASLARAQTASPVTGTNGGSSDSSAGSAASSVGSILVSPAPGNDSAATPAGSTTGCSTVA